MSAAIRNTFYFEKTLKNIIKTDLCTVTTHYLKHLVESLMSATEVEISCSEFEKTARKTAIVILHTL